MAFSASPRLPLYFLAQGALFVCFCQLTSAARVESHTHEELHVVHAVELNSSEHVNGTSSGSLQASSMHPAATTPDAPQPLPDLVHMNASFAAVAEHDGGPRVCKGREVSFCDDSVCHHDCSKCFIKPTDTDDTTAGIQCVSPHFGKGCISSKEWGHFTKRCVHEEESAGPAPTPAPKVVRNVVRRKPSASLLDFWWVGVAALIIIPALFYLYKVYVMDAQSEGDDLPPEGESYPEDRSHLPPPLPEPPQGVEGFHAPPTQEYSAASYGYQVSAPHTAAYSASYGEPMPGPNAGYGGGPGMYPPPGSMPVPVGTPTLTASVGVAPPPPQSSGF